MSEDLSTVPRASKSPGVARRVLILVLRAVLVVALFGAGWLVYRELPSTSSDVSGTNARTTNLQIVMRQPDDGTLALNVLVSFYPVDIVAVRHEFFTEPRAGKRFEDYLKERMRGRSPVSTTLDKQGHGSVVLPPGSWWLHAKLSGDEELEWRLPVTIAGPKQVIELTEQNAYTRSRTF